MKTIALVALLAFSIQSLMDRGRDLFRDTNSRAQNQRGTQQYANQEYGAAAQSFTRAQQLAPSPRNAFNLGTAQIAAGQHAEGAATLGEAMKEPSLRAEALYNRGNSALAAKAYDHAVRDYSDALRLDPRHAAAKRNLEIALTRKLDQQQSSSGGRQNQQQPQQSPQQSKADQQQQQAPQQGQADMDALLRSVQQQEQEELGRMKGKRPVARVGW